MKRLKTGPILLIMLGLVLLGLAFWRVNAYEIIGATKLYEKTSNRVFVFEKEKDRIAYHISAFFLGNQLEGAEKVGQSTYMAQSKPVIGLIDSSSEGEFQYEPNNERVEVDGLRHRMVKGVSYDFSLEADKRYTLVLKQKIKKVDYQLPNDTPVSVLSGKENESYLELIEVTEDNLKKLYQEKE